MLEDRSEIGVQTLLKTKKAPIPGRRKRDFAQNIQFNFPTEQFKRDHNWTDLKQAVKWLKQHQQHYPPYMRGLFTIQSVFGRVCFTCKHCPARLILGPNNDKLQVKTFQNHHVHGKYTCRRTQIAFGVQYIAQNIRQMNIQQLRAVLTQKFNMSEKTMWYVLRKSMRKKPWSELCKEFQEKKYEVRAESISGDEMPSLVLLISQKMLEAVRRWGDMVCFDLTYNLVKERSQKANNQWGLGMFTGMGHNKEIILMGVCFMACETTESFTFIFQNFFEIANRQPKVFLTDQQLTMKYALNKLKQQRKFAGHHILDNFHVLKNIRKRTGPQCFELYKALIRAQSQKQFDRLMNKLIKQQTFDDVIRKFRQGISMTCFSQVPARFLGFSCSSNRAEAINALVKRLVPRETYVSILIMMLEILEAQLTERAKRTKIQEQVVEELFNDGRLAVVRRSLGKKVFHKFINFYSEGLRHTLKPLEMGEYDVFDGQHHFKVYPAFGKFRCECQAGEKTGLPCPHLLSVLVKDRRAPYMEYVNPRWVIPRKTSQSLPANKTKQKMEMMKYEGKKEEMMQESVQESLQGIREQQQEEDEEEDEED